MGAIALPMGITAAKFGGIINTLKGVQITPAFAAAITKETGTNVTPSAVAQVLKANITSGVVPSGTPSIDVVPANLSSINSVVNTSDAGSVDSQGNITDLVSSATGKINNWITGIAGNYTTVAEWGFWGLIAATAVYFGRKFFHSKTGLISPRFK